MAETERLVVALEARVSAFEKNFARANRTAGSSFDKIERRSKAATKEIESQMTGLSSKVVGIGKSMAAGFVGGFVAGGIGGIVSQIGDVAKGIAEVGDQAKRAGLSNSAFQELKFVAEANRVGVDSLVDGLKELSIRGSEFGRTGKGSAAEAFGRLGYSAADLSTKLKDPSALFTEIIGKLGKLDRASQISLSDELFGGAGGEQFVQLIEAGEDALNRTRQEARDLGLVMSDELIANAAELDRQFNAASTTVAVSLKSAIVNANIALSDFIGRFNAFENRSTRLLNTNMVELGRERVEVEGKILQTQSNLNASAGENPAAEAAFRDAIAIHTERLAQILVEEGQVMETLTDRPPLAITVDGANPITPPTVPTTPTPASRGGGGASAMREQKDAAVELIAKLEEELRALALSDAEQRINAELRRAGAGATDGQKSSIRELVMQIETESAALDRLQEATDSAKGLSKDFLGGLLGDLKSGVSGAEALANAFSNLADKLLAIALDAAIEGLFASLLSGAGGGIFGMKSGGEVHAATGGLITGPGTGTSDSIPARLSDGEFVVNAAATRQNIAVLRAINDGTIAGFATGGSVGDSPSLGAANANRRALADPVATSITITAPITVNGSSGTPEQNNNLAKQMAREMESSMRGLVASVLQKQTRPGNLMNTRV